MDDLRWIALENQVRALGTSGDYDGATTLFLAEAGPEILGFLTARFGDPFDAGETFSVFAEDFWRGLARFRWECPLRGWSYALARHAACRHFRGPRTHGPKVLPLSRTPAVQAMADRVRSTTALHCQTGVKDRMRELRKQLDPQDQEILILRVDRGLAWSELAQVMATEGTELTSEMRSRAATRLRKRFERMIEKLRGLAEKDGLLGP